MVKLQQLSLALILLVFIGSWFIFQPNQALSDQIEPYITINKNNTRTNSRNVKLYLLGPEEATKMKIANEPSFDNAIWREYTTELNWTLSYGRGSKTVYVKFADQQNNNLGIFQDSIILSVAKDMDVDFVIDQDRKTTRRRYVDLSLSYSSGVEQVQISNDKNFSNSKWRSVRENFSWVLSDKKGKQTVYVKFRDANDKKKIKQDSIIYDPPKSKLDSGQLLADTRGNSFYYGYDGYLHPIDFTTIKTWFPELRDIKIISAKTFGRLAIEEPVCIRSGTWLLKFKGEQTVYAPEPGCQLQPIHSPTEAELLYGSKWQQRVIVLPNSDRFLYQITDHWSVKDGDTDQDNDGVRAEIESDFNSSDHSKDTDQDKLSDYEEINIWFTDPTDSNTDNEGGVDGREIMNLKNPLGKGDIPGVPSDSYNYPLGSLIQSDGIIYYKKQGGYYTVGKSTENDLFESNKFQERFIIKPKFEFNPNPVGELTREEIIYKPNQLNISGELNKL